MQNYLYYFLPIIGGIILFIIINLAVKAPGRALAQKFGRLGNVQGKSLKDIIAICGNPTSISSTENGKLCQWIVVGYHIALLFDENDNCLGITHEAHA